MVAAALVVAKAAEEKAADRNKSKGELNASPPFFHPYACVSHFCATRFAMSR